eukprot:NODE_10506_length_304_cov_207.883534.p2 GENE.NODE_10506_length_304_cov_207.883534~~NODE_10506_length_304_cov_207.883534.p2  ORF type:complete len:65 (+),score=16.61 NODE_10506_length_304_cov_207.883534:3-197(+)
MGALESRSPSGGLMGKAGFVDEGGECGPALKVEAGPRIDLMLTVICMLVHILMDRELLDLAARG